MRVGPMTPIAPMQVMLSPALPATPASPRCSGATIIEHPARIEQPVLRADEDLHPLAANGRVDQPDEPPPALELVEHAAQAFEVGKRLDLVEQSGPPAQDEGGVAVVFRQHGDAARRHPARELVQRRLARVEFVDDLAPRLGEGSPREAGVQIVRRLGQSRGSQPAGNRDHAVFHQAAGEHHDGERLPGLQAHELHMAHRRFALGRKHQTGRAGQAGEHFRRLAKHFVERAAVADALAFDALALVGGEVAHLEQAVDEQPQPEVGRQPARRRVRRIEQAEVLKVRHDVAHRRRRQVHRQQLRQRARPHGVSVFEETLDDFAKITRERSLSSSIMAGS